MGKIGLRHRQGNDNRQEGSKETNEETVLVQAIEESGVSSSVLEKDIPCMIRTVVAVCKLHS